MKAPGASLAGAIAALGLRFGALAGLALSVGAGEVAERLAELRSAAPDVAARAARELARLAPATAPEILGLYAGRESVPGPLAPAERELLLASLRAWPADVAVQALVSAVPAEATLDDRLVALQLVGEVGGRHAPRAVDELCAALSDEEHAHARLADEVVRTLARVLRRDARAYGELERLLARAGLRAEFEERAARALGEAGRGQGLAALEQLLGRDATLDHAVLEALGRLRPFDDPAAVARAGRTARRYLSVLDPELRRQAALALGRLRDGEAVPELLTLVDDGDRRVQRGASMALGWISGLDADAPPEAWLRWHENELAWLESEADALRLDLASDQPARVLGALRILCSHPWEWSSVVAEIQPLLAHAEEHIAVAACGALVKLDDVTAFVALLEALDDGRAPVEAAAQAALTTLTGATLGPDPEAWRAWLEPTLP